MTREKQYDLVIAGAGPVGLLAGIAAASEGTRTLIVEKNTEPIRHSKSIGIHPPSLAILSRLRLLDDFRPHGMVIRRGVARADGTTQLGVLDFQSLNAPFNYILAIPQWKTESVFEERLQKINPGNLLRGFAVTGFDRTDSKPWPMEISLTDPDGITHTVGTHYLLACDGKNSTLRVRSGIPFPGSAYRNRYAMGDFSDNTGFASDAVIFLGTDGLMESFPLPGGLRRWVVQQDPSRPINGIPQLAGEIFARCGITPDPETCTMFSEFGVERFLADRFWQDRVLLAGDAAHVVSPIGGQGMNLGWINVMDAVSAIGKAVRGEMSMEEAGSEYDTAGRKRAMKVMRRAELNMMLGNRNRLPGFRNVVVRFLLQGPFSDKLRERLTMQGL